MNSLIEIPLWMGTVAWQSTLCLASGLLITALLRHRPARAHLALLLAAIAALVIPVGTAVIERNGWGILAGDERLVATTSSLSDLASQTQELPTVAIQDATGESNRATTPLLDAENPSRGQSPSPRITGPPVVRLHYVWAVSSAVVLFAILVGMLLETLCLHRTSSPILDPSLQRAAREAARCLGLPSPPTLLCCKCVDSPTIWSWAHPPHILLPPTLVQTNKSIDNRASGSGTYDNGHMPLTRGAAKYGGDNAADYMVGMYKPSLDPSLSEAQKTWGQNEIFMQLLKNRGGNELLEGGSQHHVDVHTWKITPYHPQHH